MALEFLTVNFSGKVRRSTLLDRECIVVPMSMIVPGVLHGSEGPLYYSEEMLRKHDDIWNHVPLVLRHPTNKYGLPVSARSPEILNQFKLGEVMNSRVDTKGRLVAEGWFFVDRLQKVAPDVLERLERGEPIELSTGMSATYQEAPRGSVFNNREYTHVIQTIKPDHLAILPDQVGACSLEHGCGVLVNEGRDRVSETVAKIVEMGYPVKQDHVLNAVRGGSGRWITIRGSHVYIGKSGKVLKGPAGLKAKINATPSGKSAKTGTGRKAGKGADAHSMSSYANHVSKGAKNPAGHKQAAKAHAEAYRNHRDLAKGKHAQSRVGGDHKKLAKFHMESARFHDTKAGGKGQLSPVHTPPKAPKLSGGLSAKKSAPNSKVERAAKKQAPTGKVSDKAKTNIGEHGVALPKNKKKLNIAQSHTALKEMGYEVAKGSSYNPKTGQTSYKIRTPKGKVAILTSKQISKLVYTGAKKILNALFPQSAGRPGSLITNEGEPDMATTKTRPLTKVERKAVVNSLINNCDCQGKKQKNGVWTEEDREVLNSLTDEKLIKLERTRRSGLKNARIANAAVTQAADMGLEFDSETLEFTQVNNGSGKGKSSMPDLDEEDDEAPPVKKAKKAAKVVNQDDEEDDDDDEEPAQKKAPVVNKQRRPQTVKEYLREAPPEVARVVQNAMNQMKQTRARQVAAIVANAGIADEEEAEAYTNELMAMNDSQFALVQKASKASPGLTDDTGLGNKPVLNYSGAAGGAFRIFNNQEFNSAHDEFIPKCAADLFELDDNGNERRTTKTA